MRTKRSFDLQGTSRDTRLETDPTLDLIHKTSLENILLPSHEVIDFVSSILGYDTSL